MLPDKKEQRKKTLERYIRRLKARLEDFKRIDERFFRARIATFSGAVLAGMLAVFTPLVVLWEWTAIVFLGAFAVAVYLQRQTRRTQGRFRTAVSVAETQLARMELDWTAIPQPPEISLSQEHPFAADLNLTGDRSIHALLNTATSREGGLRLATWLSEPEPDLTRTKRRQALIREMLPLTGFRSRLALLGHRVKEQNRGYWDAKAVLRWLQGEKKRSLSPVLTVLFGLAAANLTLFFLNAAGVLPPYWMLTGTVYATIYMFRYRDYEELFGEAYSLAKSLDQFRGILTYIERYPFCEKEGLAELCSPFQEEKQRPSRFLRRIVWIVSAASLQGNQFLAFLVNVIMPWSMLFAHLLEQYKAELGAVLPRWLDAWYELEALNSLGNFAHLNPETVFPEIVEGGEPVFEGVALGHPLLKDELRVSNDFSLKELGEIAILTGSNMSGKSTYLRTLGVNLSLAYAGCTVQARRLQTIPFRLYTAIQVKDSLADGISYFYAEVRRLKALLEALHEENRPPLFFLIDEIFRGTNNLERQIGSQSYVRALAEGRGVGVISTHDLELIHLADEGENILNYHFREDVRDGRMSFDYLLRPGPSPTTNALKIMRLEGLPVQAFEDKTTGE